MADKTGVEFLAAWEQLDDASKNKLLQSIQDDPLFEQPRVTSWDTKGAADIESIEATTPNLYSDVQLRPYLSYLYYYPTIQWSLDKTPDTDNYWVGLYAKDEKNDKKYLAYQWIRKTAQGSYKVGKLKTTEYKYGSSRIEEYEVRIFKQGYQRLDAQSNILRGVVSHLPTNIFSPGAGKLISSQDRRQSDEELDRFLAGIQGDANTTALSKFSSPADVLKQWATFTQIQKQLMFPILEQDSLPETIKKPGDRGTDRPEPNVYFADHSKLEGVADPSEAPSQIVLTITLDYSSTYTYPEVDVENEVPSDGAWLGVYRTQRTTDFGPDGYIKSQCVGRGQKGSHELSYIKEDNPGPTKSTYIGPIFDKKNQQLGIAATTIGAVISVDPPLPPAIFKPDFDKDESLKYAKLSNLAYEEYWIIQQQIANYGLAVDMHIYDAKTDTHGFIASDDESVVIAFRGTNSYTNKWTDIKYLKERIVEGQPYFAHIGFLHAFRKVYDHIEAHIKPFIGKKKIYTTGHSLGAALASLLAFQISHKYENAKPIHYVFGCPPIGDINLSEYFKEKRSHIITIQNDHVATGPVIYVLAVWGFFQPYQLMFLPEVGSHSILDYIAQLEKLP